MTTKTINIQAWGNSQGIRLTRDVLRSIGITDLTDASLSLEVKNGEIRLSPAMTPWERLFKNAHGRLPEPVNTPAFELEPPTRLHVTPEQQAAVYDYLDYIGHNKTLFLSTHQKLGATGWTKPNLLPLNDLSIDDLGKALFCGMIPDKPSRILEEI